MTGDPAPWWEPTRFAARRPKLEARAAILAATRRWFEDSGFIEVETPALQVSPGLEVHLRAFSTRLHEPFEEDGRPFHLHTSPEFAMKKLLVAGMPKIFQTARVFRDGERAATHHPEFTMLEWYRAGGAWPDLVADCEALLQRCLAVAADGPDGVLSWQGLTADPAAPWERLSVAEAFQIHADIDILATAPTLADRALVEPDPAALAAEAKRIGIATEPGDRWEDVFFRIFLDRIEPKLGIGAPTVLYDYPAAMAALARLKPGDPRLAERFEVYVCGLELANAFAELTDPIEQRRRFEIELARKQALYGIRYPIDEDFLAALDHGMPPSAGIALGFDRLVMLATGADHIDDVLWAPVA